MKPFFLTYFLLASIAVFSQHPSMGARFSALSDAAVAAKGLWALPHNPAGLAFLQHSSAGVGVENRFGLVELNRVLSVGYTNFFGCLWIKYAAQR